MRFLRRFVDFDIPEGGGGGWGGGEENQIDIYKIIYIFFFRKFDSRMH